MCSRNERGIVKAVRRFPSLATTVGMAVQDRSGPQKVKAPRVPIRCFLPPIIIPFNGVAPIP